MSAWKSAEPSADQTMPLLSVIPPACRVLVPSRSTRISSPAPAVRAGSMLPIHSRPAASAVPSLTSQPSGTVTVPYGVSRQG